MASTHPIEPVGAELFEPSTDGRITLLGGRHRATGRLVFPKPSGQDHEPERLPSRGTLWSWTVQRFRPKSPPYAGPEDFEPYAVGYVDLGGLIVEGRLTGAPLDGYRIGMPMRVVPLELMLGGPPRQVLTYAFEPEGLSE
ncbi:Zn-ribbon domain-containing OB-fold protein [Aquibium microcysteis]|uniref:Zn-ribbon domain-containing OB-fold protein n=1 Tax=Aquibium microcysteis TaxID=675281 RepID=UPI00165CFFC7|nr:OB-fold domain-containing protein [Aquibium microcysteis]